MSDNEDKIAVKWKTLCKSIILLQHTSFSTEDLCSKLTEQVSLNSLARTMSWVILRSKESNTNRKTNFDFSKYYSFNFSYLSI